VPLDGLEETDTAQVATASAHDKIADTEFDVVLDLATLEVDLDSVVDFDVRMRITDRAAVMGGEERNAFGTKLDSANLAQLEIGLFVLNAMQSKSSFRVVEKTEVLVSSVDGDDIHEARREGGVRAHLAIDFHNPLHQNKSYFSPSESITKAVAKEDHKGQAFAQLVRPTGWARSENTSHFGEHPVMGSIDTLEVLLGTTRHDWTG